MPTSRQGGSRRLQELTSRRIGSGPHLPPGRAHLRAARERFRASTPPDAPFPRKLASFLGFQIWGWLVSYIKFRFGCRHAFPTYSSQEEAGIYPLSPSPDEADSAVGPIRVSIAGDWATGTQQSQKIAQFMEDLRPHYTIHLGDVYFVGDCTEVKTNCLGEPPPGVEVRGVRWPCGSAGQFALNGNHEMYANGNGYFDVFLPRLGLRSSPGGPFGGQKAGYFCLRNRFWDIIALDTGYNSVGLPFLELLPWFAPDCKLRDPQVQWLRDTVKPGQSGRGIVLLTHHQNYSAFEGIITAPARQLAEFIDRPVIWLWGHEHRFAVYGKAKTPQGIESFGRCIGHGGMPVEIGARVKHAEYPLVLYDDRRYRLLDGVAAGFNGFANLTFHGNKLEIEYRDINNRVILRERWRNHEGILRGESIEQLVNSPDIHTPRKLTVAIGRDRAGAAYGAL